ncbi:PTS sugar transporter subunit IIA [Testudinibacter sp. TR-2022]|uniref:PTS galactosamine/N-acetylgalactosamine transporter subunit IIA n=1 Tax=Testudinibacter sp. TR-2022 TaxID=2585029 RepID=UPI00111BC0D6|nr:PTS galactosamine/N-acetylgalactosamine transporter subunit IIA [Testudinibacter sp. TR-2022]TNH04094.1 PTS sugar transporter subunit IIA [Pasteurellaceae bacterium Phil31]TNH09058.1 PTS sugar transporter subunit IIA [Testudinibacter sp. TR-2022]TNH12895.1 PTS sugar transporter subunit IIA [Testudinibacter sp. TR-2022]TNH13111.1 PTS sugar transporter subunit IIA [Testudinibacter sp. TR-2022]TNH18206.1 PTS sugar transporter subunit IIA [Testudinibacter sp. TR-2022]
MISIIVLGHGRFASGIQYAVNQIIGEQDNIAFIDFPESKSPAQLKQEILTALEQLNHTRGVLFCCDILGGSPFRTASLIAQELPIAEVITGSNLQMLIECSMEKDELAFADLVELALSSGKQGITKLSDELSQSKQRSVQQEDGI